MDKRPHSDVLGRGLVPGAIVTQAAGRVNENAQRTKASVIGQQKRSNSCELLLLSPMPAEAMLLRLNQHTSHLNKYS
jgi:hypothetical protein